MPRKPKLSQHLRDARVQRGLSVAYVAQQVDVSTASVYFWETGYCRPRSEHLKTLCKVLKLPIRATQEIAAAG